MGRIGQQSTRHLEAIEVRESDVEDDDGGTQVRGGPDRTTTVSGLADDVEAKTRKELTRHRPEPGMVVDDQDGESVHPRSVGCDVARRHGAGTCDLDASVPRWLGRRGDTTEGRSPDKAPMSGALSRRFTRWES